MNTKEAVEAPAATPTKQQLIAPPSPSVNLLKSELWLVVLDNLIPNIPTSWGGPITIRLKQIPCSRPPLDPL
eukprot:1177001-Prorocentrum_minimum.AAC.11